jgi:CMP-N-acetylneuraminic acid synthetase
MKVTALLPLKKRSERLPGKNFLELGGMPLFCQIAKTLNQVPAIDEICIYASDEIFSSIAQEHFLPVKQVDRSTDLDQDETSITSVISAFCQQSDADIIVLAHATSPFITKETISTCVKAVVEKKNDSAFVAIAMQKFAWFNEIPLNYRLSESLPRTQDLQPLIIEQSGIYVFSRVKFLENLSRIGNNPYIHIVSEFEGLDIDDEFDYKIAKAYLS